jgi:hypothetical protein
VGCPVSTPHGRNFLGACGAAFLGSVSPPLRRRLRPGAVVSLAAALVALPAGCADKGTAQAVPSAASPAAPGAAWSTAPVSADRDDEAVRLVLVVDGEQIATATLADTRAARDLAALLPVTIAIEDRFGQAKIGRLPDELAYIDVGLVLDPAAGHVYYWPSDRSIAVLTADLGPSIPAPGLIDLGVVDTGLQALASAGNRFEMDIGPAV